MNEHVFNAQVGTNPDGTPKYQRFVIKANSFAEARAQLEILVAAATK